MCRKRFSALGCIAVAVLASFLSLKVHSHQGETHRATNNSEAISAAVDWLGTSQQEDGAIVTPLDEAADFQSTSEALIASVQVGGGSINTEAVLSYLESATVTQSTEQLAGLIIALQALDRSALTVTQELLKRQSGNGGFGDYPGYDSNPLATAQALLALQSVGRDTAVAARALNYLSSAQLSTGGFGYYGNQSSAGVTALVVKALRPYLYTFNISAVLSRASDFLYALKSDNNRWNTDWESALILQALIPVTTDVSRYQQSVAALESNQLASGSWEEQVYSTALAISTLNLLANLEVPADPEKAIVRGRLVDAAGGAALTNARIEVRDFDRESVSFEDSGQFVVSNLDPGAYTLTYSAPGYLSASQSLSLQKGQFADVGTIRLSIAPSASLISGVLTDITTGEPIVGAVVAVTVNGASANAISNTKGEYQLLVELGEAVLSVTADDYHAISASVTLAAGTAVNFSPGLLPISESRPPSTSISGVIQNESSQPLPGVSVRLAGVDSTVSGGDGHFVLDNLSAGEVSVEIAKAGYETLSAQLILPEKTHVNLGNITLREHLVLPATSISGQVLDISTGTPVPGASVTVGSTSTTTDNNGFYSLRDIPVLEFTVQVNASGYLYTGKDISLTEHNDLSLNITIRRADLGGVEVAAVNSNALRYGAYEPVLIGASLENNSELELGARLYVKVKSSAGSEVASFSARYLPPLASALDEEELAHYQQHLEDAIERLSPGERREVQLEQWWNTQNIPPGDYVVTVQAIDATTSNLVSEKSLVVTIEETRKLAALRLSANPGYVLLNRDADVVVSAELLNRSNISSVLTFDYRLVDPEGQILTDDQATITLSPNQDNLIVELSRLLHQFTASGNYLLEASSISGMDILDSSTGNIFVPPSIRLDIHQSLTPNEVVPLEGTGVMSNIQIKGVDGE